MTFNPHEVSITRRKLLTDTGVGFGVVALADIFCSNARPAVDTLPDGQLLPATKPHFPVKAKHVIHIYLNGGMSHVDTFDPKPALRKHAGKMLPVEYAITEAETGAALPSPFEFKKYGESGIEVSEIFPQLGECVDDMAVIRSMYSDSPIHHSAMLLMSCGANRLVRPSLGSWMTYGLGTENENLPAFVAMCPSGYPEGGKRNWRSAVLPGQYHGTYVDSKETEIDKLFKHLRNTNLSLTQQRRQLDLVQRLNGQHLDKRKADDNLEARIQLLEVAYRMQVAASDAFDISQEPKHVLETYGSGVHGRQLLIARRLVERGVRFVQLWHNNGAPWDSHDFIAQKHRRLAAECDRPMAALLEDLKQRSLLDETLVVCGSEFGRTPTVEIPQPGGNSEHGKGRDHNPYGFTVWLAGGGVKGGYVHGATDEFGFRAVENRVHVRDLHATILHLLGLDHKKLSFSYGDDEIRLTGGRGRVIHDLIA